MQLNSHKNRIFVADEYVKAKFNEQNDIPYFATFLYIHRHLNNLTAILFKDKTILARKD